MFYCSWFNLSCAWVISLFSALVQGFVSLSRAVLLLVILVLFISFFLAEFGLVLVSFNSFADNCDSQYGIGAGVKLTQLIQQLFLRPAPLSRVS